MHIDDNDFFREATMRICGSLEIEKALGSCLQFLRKSIPLDRLILQRFDETQNAMRTIAVATATECLSVDYLTPLSEEARNCAHEEMTESHGVYISETPDTCGISREMLEFHDVPCTSLMVMPLQSEELIVGHLVCITEGEEKLNTEHARLISLLRDPFTIALSNTLKHRNELKLYDRNFFWDATMRICSSLEIEKAMFSTLQFLQQEMPVSIMFLEHYSEDLQSNRTIAIADSTGGKSVDLLTPLSPKAQDRALSYYSKTPQKVYLFEDINALPMGKEMMQFHKVDLSSIILLPLQIGEQKLGLIVLGSEGEGMFTQEHANLISLLSEPFAIALSNTLKHRSELKLYDRDFFWEATTRICGSLNIEKALWQSLLFLQDYIPVEEASLNFYDPEKGTITLNIHADKSGGRLVNFQAHYPPEIRAILEDVNQLGDFIENRAEEHPIAKPILKAMGKGKSSVINVRLIVEGHWIGSVSLWAEGWDKFNEEHMRLMKQLKQPFFIALSNSRRFSELLELKDLLADDNRYLQEELQKISGSEIIGADFGLKDVMDKVRRVATLSSPVLLQGETGVGKEIIAAAIHNSSQRRDGPFIKVNCGAIPETLMDSELFGHEKGAFTGAIEQKRGRFERATGGTIFLDEIGELSPEAQVRLLRVLQEMEIERVGGTDPIEVDIRVLAATHRDLDAMIREGTFREDLYFRLDVFPIYIPPLRERSGDVPGLVQHFIQKKSRELQLPSIPTLAPNAYDQLLAHHWPGNVRELENAVERAIILHREEPLSFAELVPKEKSEMVSVFVSKDNESCNLDQVTTNHIRKVLEITRGRVEGEKGAADLLGINPGTLRGRMRKLGISFGRNNK
ncbi:MAG: sigma 54-interacting transcriptional regulator [Desulfobacterales bacterium]|nr:sigma 54-interacting transcriptional regulator [Desulfobacterales bacterium]